MGKRKEFPYLSYTEPVLKDIALFYFCVCVFYFQVTATAIGTPLPLSPAFVAVSAVLIFTVMKWIQVCLEKSSMNLSFFPFIKFYYFHLPGSFVAFILKIASSLVKEVHNFASA